MNVDPLGEEAIDPPTPALLQRYLSLGPPRKFTLKDLEDHLGSSSKARQFTTKVRGLGLIVRIDRGEYVAVDPSTSVRAWAIPDYYAQLLVLHDAFDQLGIDHAFACLAAGTRTDLIFDRPWVVTAEPADEGAPKIDRFTYPYGNTEVQELEILGQAFDLPVLPPEEAALVLASTGLPRETEAARELVDAHPPPESLVPAFNYTGLDVGQDNLDVEDPGIGFPAFIEDRRQRLGEELLREGRP